LEERVQMSFIDALKRSAVRNPIAAICLMICLGGGIAQGVFPASGLSIAVVWFFGVYLVIAFRNIARVGRVLLLISFAIAVLALVDGIGADIFAEAAARVVFLSALLTAVAFLRIAATRDPFVEVAGEFLTLQPPTRRYASLGAGGHLFGVLLNLGGLGVMLEVIMKGLKAHRHEMDDFVFEARKRRMVSACMRGFSSIALWTPFGVALNLMILTIPGLQWSNFAPYGIALAGVLFLLGWLLDTVEWWHPPSARGRASALTGDLPRWAHWAVGIVAGHILVLGAVVVALDRATEFSFQTVLITIVPLYALFWVGLRGGIGTIPDIARRFVAQAPGYATEMSVIASAGFIGLVALEVVPVEWIADHLGLIATRPDRCAVGHDGVPDGVAGCAPDDLGGAAGGSGQPYRRGWFVAARSGPCAGRRLEQHHLHGASHHSRRLCLFHRRGTARDDRFALERSVRSCQHRPHHAHCRWRCRNGAAVIS
jgi:hypothetical protein